MKKIKYQILVVGVVFLMQVKHGTIEGVSETCLFLEKGHSYLCIISKVLKSEPIERVSRKKGREEERKAGREGGRRRGGLRSVK